MNGLNEHSYLNVIHSSQRSLWGEKNNSFGLFIRSILGSALDSVHTLKVIFPLRNTSMWKRSFEAASLKFASKCSLGNFL